MISFRYLASLALAACVVPMSAQDRDSAYIGSAACGKCHALQFESQSKTAHARALRPAQPTDPGRGSHAQWAFGAGAKAITWVSQTGQEAIAEHGMSYYTATKSLALTPGHTTSADTVYRTFDPVATALRCFRCHSTGPITLAANFQVQPSQAGVHCESCHGSGGAHVSSGGRAAIQNPKRLSAVQINTLCGACHRQASDLDDDRDWSNSWNVRHQPSYLHRAACFRNSQGALSCLTCHDPHQPLKIDAAYYDGKCVSCHANAVHSSPAGARSCASCHMPQVAISANLKFTNHWIGIYDPRGRQLIPSKRTAPALQPSPAKEESAGKMIVPADVATLAPVYARAVAEREREAGQDSAKVARAVSDLGLFLLQIGNSNEAEGPLRRAVALGERNRDPAIDRDREGLAQALEAQGKRNEALEIFKRLSEAKNPRVSARSLVKLAELEPQNAEVYYRNAVAAEERASGTNSQRLAVVLHAYAAELRARKRDPDAEPLLRRALAIQQAAQKSDPRVTIEILNTLGNLLEGRKQLDDAEKLLHASVTLAEEKFGPESPQLATSCTYLADVLWSKKNLREAGLLFRRAIAINASLYGPDRPETAADIANLGMLMNEAGQADAGAALLRQALAIYESTLGSNSAEARFVREHLGKSGR